MDTNALFLNASRQKFRFPTAAGPVNVEDLWDLPLTSARGVNLNDIAKVLYKQIKEADGEVNFVESPTAASRKTQEIQAKFDVVKSIIDIKKVERDTATAEKEKAEKKQKLMELINKKQDAELEGKSLDDLKQLLSQI
jgi:hypothetical protein